MITANELIAKLKNVNSTTFFFDEIKLSNPDMLSNDDFVRGIAKELPHLLFNVEPISIENQLWILYNTNNFRWIKLQATVATNKAIELNPTNLRYITQLPAIIDFNQTQMQRLIDDDTFPIKNYVFSDQAQIFLCDNGLFDEIKEPTLDTLLYVDYKQFINWTITKDSNYPGNLRTLLYRINTNDVALYNALFFKLAHVLRYHLNPIRTPAQIAEMLLPVAKTQLTFAITNIGFLPEEEQQQMQDLLKNGNMDDVINIMKMFGYILDNC